MKINKNNYQFMIKFTQANIWNCEQKKQKKLTKKHF